MSMNELVSAAVCSVHQNVHCLLALWTGIHSAMMMVKLLKTLYLDMSSIDFGEVQIAVSSFSIMILFPFAFRVNLVWPNTRLQTNGHKNNLFEFFMNLRCLM